MTASSAAVATDIKDILVVIDLDGNQPAAAVGIDIAGRTAAHVTGLSLVYDLVIPTYGFGTFPAEVIIAAREEALQQANKAGTQFEEMARRAGVSHGCRRADGVFFGVLDEVVRQSRLCDLVTIRRDGSDGSEPMRTALTEALLFDSGTPILVVPETPKHPFALDRACIAWDGSALAARAVRAALPLLARSSHIDVITVEASSRLAEESGVDIGTYLGRHGLSVSIEHIGTLGQSVAATLLGAASRLGSDWMVSGGYGHSRVREQIFGGATYDLVRDSEIPLLLVH